MDREPDGELVHRARGGDKCAFDELAARYQETVRRAVARMVRDKELARDLTQEALLAAYLSLDRLRDAERFAAWLYGIALNVCRSNLRDRNLRSVSLQVLAGGMAFEAVSYAPGSDPAMLAEARELHVRVWEAVEELSPANRAATLLFYYDGLSLAEIAEMLDISVAAVKGRLFKARAQLRRALFEFEQSSQPERSEKMIPVQVADVVKQERRDEQGQTLSMSIVVLYDVVGRRVLNIWVGPIEARAIAVGLYGETAPRPMTYDFMAKLLEGAAVRVEAVRIETLANEVFYAAVRVRNGETTREIDARPSDAIALAVRTGTPITVADEIMDKCGRALPPNAALPLAARGIEELANEWSAELGRVKAFMRPSEQDIEKSERELIASIFGSQANRDAG
jgi:RNA polymerase sigma factor (sigma-70 family)